METVAGTSLVQKYNLEVLDGLTRDIHNIPLQDLKFLFKCVHCGKAIKNHWEIVDVNYDVTKVVHQECEFNN